MTQTAKSGQAAVSDDKDGWHIEAILGPEYIAPVRTVNALVDVIVDRQHTSRLVQELQRLSPIPTLKHLKRVCPDGRILIALADESSKVEYSNAGKSFSKKVSLVAGDCISPSERYRKSSVARKRSFPDPTREHRFSSENVAGNVEVPALAVDDCVPTISESSLYENSSKKTTVFSERSSSSASTNKPCRLRDPYTLPAGLDTEGLRGRLVCVPVPAVPPLTRSQFLEAQRIWSCNFHPVLSVETALAPGAGIQADERRQLLEALRRCAAAMRTSNTECAAAAVDPRDGHILALAVDMRKVHPLQHAAMRLIDLVARTQGGGVWPRLPDELMVDTNDDSATCNGLAYLCTRLDIVMTREPCAMCAMALTHARACRVFFSEDNIHGGMLYSHLPSLQTLPGLNHRLRVFRAPLLDKATS